MNKTVFCAECRKDVNFVTKETEFKRTLKDNEYSFIGLEAYCAECGSPIYVSEIEDNNLSLLYNIYSKEKRSVANEKGMGLADCAGAAVRGWLRWRGNDNYCVDVYVRNRLAERLRVRSV